MKSRKFKIAAVAILATLTFATTAFAGIFDVLGGIILGAGTLSNYYTQKGQGAGNNYLDKMVKKINETGDPDAAFNDVVKEYQDGKYDVQVTEADGSKIKTMTATKSDMVVRAIWTLDKNTQTISVKHENVTSGSQVGDVISKSYTLPGGNLMATDSSNQATPIQQTQSGFASVISNAEINRKFSIAPFVVKDSPHRKEYILNDITGCAAYDNSELKGDPLFAYHAYRVATGTAKLEDRDATLEDEAKKRNDPFLAPKLKEACAQLVSYYKSGNKPNLYVYNVYDYITGDVNQIIKVATHESVISDSYHLKSQIYKMEVYSYYGLEHFRSLYDLKIPKNTVESLYRTVDKIMKDNNAVFQKFSNSKGNCPKQKITVVRVCKGLDTICNHSDIYAIYENAHYAVKAMDGYVSLVNYKKVYDFKNSQWRDLFAITGTNCNSK